MTIILRLLSACIGALLLFTGAQWLLDPTTAAATLGMPLLDGIGRSTQLGDFTAFFLAAGLMVLVGLALRQAAWMRSAALLLGVAAAARLVAWLAYDAALATDFIAVELVGAIVLLVTARAQQRQTGNR